MKKLLIIYPHWPPSNLAGVHRSRLLANFLPDHGWQPIVLSVKPEFYEENLDWDLTKTVKPHVQLHAVNAFRIHNRWRLIGDIGLRGFFQLYQGAKKIIENERIDAILIPIPIYYTALLGPLLFAKYKIPYGIDYIDPWSDGIAGADRPFGRAWLSNQLANFLEPLSLRKAQFVTGVSEKYFQYVYDRGWLKKGIPSVGMPYGFDPDDHAIRLENIQVPWSKETHAWVYAGAFLPKSHAFIQSLFETIAKIKSEGLWPEDHRLYFLGTGNYKEKSISTYAQEAGIAELVVENRQRFPYLHILHFLQLSHRVMVIGSTEIHYTASKTFQAILSQRPVFSMLHKESSATEILESCGCGHLCARYSEDMDSASWQEIIKITLLKAIKDTTYTPDLHKLQPYSASESAKKLAELLNQIVS
ncbi:MAG: hypothetical protein K2Q22_15350 [Cytophagales bacterium]|nr:hypothetical protein [Cytophagales bacterium]